MKYDVIVLGAGSAGLNIAGFMNTLKLKVLLVEKHRVGGDCLNYGCVPSKSLLAIANIIASARKTEAFGPHMVGNVEMNRVARKIRERQEIIRVHENPEYFRQKGIDVEIGEPRFTSPKTIQVNDKEYRARHIVIATGSRPAIPPIPGIEKVDYLTNETVFSNKKLPPHLLVIGGGPIGVELAQAYRRLGSQVTLLEQASQILPREDTGISQILARALTNEGVNIRTGANIEGFLMANKVTVKDSSGNDELITFDRLLIAAGRKLNIEGLDLEKGNVQVSNNRIMVDQYQRTTNRRVFVCGDAAGSFMFTHWAEYQAAVAIKNMLSPFKKKIQRSRVAWVTYTDPEIATFGRQPHQMEAAGISFETVSVPLEDVDRAICEDIHDGLLKLYLSKGKIMGGTLAGKNAGEIAGEMIAFMTLKIPFSKMYERVYPYPTMARVQRKAVQQYLGRKLTPAATRILRILFKLF